MKNTPNQREGTERDRDRKTETKRDTERDRGA